MECIGNTHPISIKPQKKSTFLVNYKPNFNNPTNTEFMSELKTKATNESVTDYLDSIEHPTRKADGFLLLKIFQEETGEKPVMWGPSIVGFGKFNYKYSSGKEMDWFPVGFSPRKQSLSIYIMLSKEEIEPYLAKLGKFKKSKGCIYINKMSDVNEEIFREMIRTSINLVYNNNQ